MMRTLRTDDYFLVPTIRELLHLRDTSAFVVTNPPDESNSSRLAIIWNKFGG
jgi:hypothetical protein